MTYLSNQFFLSYKVIIMSFDHHAINDMLKPTSKLDFTAINKEIKFDNIVSDTTADTPKQMNLLDFSRMYKIYEIPIMDFVIIYIILYCLNCIFFECDFKIIFVATLMMTLILNIIFNDKIRVTTGLVLILIITMILFMIMAHSEFKSKKIDKKNVNDIKISNISINIRS